MNKSILDILSRWTGVLFCFLVLPGMNVHTTVCITIIFEQHSRLKVKVKVAQSCLTLCHPMDCIVRGILQARILEWIAYPFSSGSSRLRNQTSVSCNTGGFLTKWAIRETESCKSQILYEEDSAKPAVYRGCKHMQTRRNGKNWRQQLQTALSTV